MCITRVTATPSPPAPRYLTGHLDRLHYDTARAAGRPIATGAVEDARRHLIAHLRRRYADRSTTAPR